MSASVTKEAMRLNILHSGANWGVLVLRLTRMQVPLFVVLQELLGKRACSWLSCSSRALWTQREAEKMKEIEWKFHIRGPQMKHGHRVSQHLWSLATEAQRSRSRTLWAEEELGFFQQPFLFWFTAERCQRQRGRDAPRSRMVIEVKLRSLVLNDIIVSKAFYMQRESGGTQCMENISYSDCQRPWRESLGLYEYRSTRNWHDSHQGA